MQAGEQDFFYLSSLDDRVRPKRFYFQPGERAYRVELIYEHDAWRNDTRITMPKWRVGRATTLDDAVAPHMAHVERAYALQAGREIRVMVMNDQVDDAQAIVMSKEIARAIETEATYPGQVRVVVVRETRASDYAR